MNAGAIDRAYTEPHVLFSVDALADAEPDVATPVAATHRGTGWMGVRDPEGRVYSLEEAEGS